MLSAHQITKSYGIEPVLAQVTFSVNPGERLGLIGPNGCGKTTLLRSLTGSLPLLAGNVQLSQGTRLGYMDQEQLMLDPGLSALETIQQLGIYDETEARSFLRYYLFSGDDPLRPSASLSFGERARLALATLALKGCNLLLLDEPVNHLDIPSRLRFEQALLQFEGAVLAVVHDRYFIEHFANRVWEIHAGGIVEVI